MPVTLEFSKKPEVRNPYILPTGTVVHAAPQMSEEERKIFSEKMETDLAKARLDEQTRAKKIKDAQKKAEEDKKKRKSGLSAF